nr:hypothetical protein [Burkholderia ambifaria]
MNIETRRFCREPQRIGFVRRLRRQHVRPVEHLLPELVELLRLVALRTQRLRAGLLRLRPRGNGERQQTRGTQRTTGKCGYAPYIGDLSSIATAFVNYP